MGMLNDQVRMGAPLADILPFATRPEFRSLGRILHLGDLTPMGQSLVQPLEGVGLIGGGGLLAGSFLVKPGTASLAMMIAGGLGLAASVISIGMRLASAPAVRMPLPTTTTPATPGGAAGLVQSLVSDYKQYAPAVKEVKNLFAPAA